MLDASSDEGDLNLDLDDEEAESKSPRRAKSPIKKPEPASPTVNYVTTKEGRKIIDAATLDQLVKVFAEETQDLVAINHLILAHEHFVSSVALFNRFVHHFKNPEEAANAQVVQFRIVNIFKKWIEVNFASFESDKKLRDCLDEFLAFLKANNNNLSSYIDKAISAIRDPLSVALSAPKPSERPSVMKTKKKKSKKEDWELTDFEPEEIARQITLIDHEMLKNIKISEMLKTRWIKKQSPTIEAAGKKVNQLAYWIAYQAISPNSPKKRAAILTHIIKIARFLLDMNNFNSLMAFYLALNFPGVVRMTQTWKNIPNKYFVVWKKLCSLMSPKNNFKNYRKFIETRQMPLIPCQEIYLKDLLYHEEGTEDFIAQGVIDTKKLDQMGQLLEYIRQTQLKSYVFAPYQVLHDYLDGIRPDISVEELDALSMANEPSSINFDAARAGMKSSLKDNSIYKTMSLPSTRRNRAKSSSEGSDSAVTSPAAGTRTPDSALSPNGSRHNKSNDDITLVNSTSADSLDSKMKRMSLNISKEDVKKDKLIKLMKKEEKKKSSKSRGDIVLRKE
jgi:hypothetical protein